MVFFDLPVKSKEQVRAANRFRTFLIRDGYHMVQFSVYARVCNGYDSVEVHKKRVKRNLPDSGSVRLLIITERQYNNVEILLGEPSENDRPQNMEQLMLF